MARRPVIPFAFAIGALAGGMAFANVPGCSLGGGTGSATGWLNAPTCWTGPIDLRPDFFAAVPSLPSLLIRIQNGGDYESFSDGIAFDIEDIGAIRGDPLSDGTPQSSLLCTCNASSAQCPGPDAGGSFCPACSIGSPRSIDRKFSQPF